MIGSMARKNKERFGSQSKALESLQASGPKAWKGTAAPEKHGGAHSGPYNNAKHSAAESSSPSLMISIVSKSQLAHHHGRSPDKAGRTLGTTKTGNKIRNDDRQGPSE